MGRQVSVGFPVGGSVTVPFMASLLQLQGYEYDRKINSLTGALDEAAQRGRAVTPADGRRLIMASRDALRLAHIQHCSGLYVGTNRTELTKRFLKTDAEWLLQIDTDIEFPRDIIDKMLDLAGDDKKILAASVPLGTGIPTTGYYATDKPGIFDSVRSVSGKPLEVDGIATACALIHREVFERIAAEHGQSWWNHITFPKLDPRPASPAEQEYLEVGEDLSFSIRAQRCGFKLWCVHVGGFGHWKTNKLSHDNELALAMAAQDTGCGEIVED